MVLASAILGETRLAAAPPAPDQAILPISQVKPGLKGYGLTVTSGDRVERFDVEVIGVLTNQPPGRSSILVKVAGLNLEHTGIVAGMSGSPVFFDGKLAGAVSGSWPFSKDPVGIVTPIEAMLEIDPAPPPAGAIPVRSTSASGSDGLAPRSASAFLDLLALPEDERIATMRSQLAGLLPAARAGAGSLLSPMSAGIPLESFDRFGDVLPRLGLGFDRSLLGATSGLSGGLGNATAQAPQLPAGPLAIGSAVTALLVDGDIQLGATGTVTYVSSDGRFFAFGHPFLGFGELDLPVAPAKVVSIVASQYQSFKLAQTQKAVYRLTRDRDTGISGRTDRTAPMIPVTLTFESTGGHVASRELKFSLAPHPRLLPVLVALASDAALTTLDPTPRDRTLHFAVSLETAAGTIRYEDEATGSRAKDLALLTASTLTSLVSENDLEDPKISRIDLSFRSESGERRLRVVDAALSARKVSPGAAVSLVVRLVDRRGEETTRVVTLHVPRETPEGKALVVVADGSNASTLRFALNPAEPRTLGDFGRFVSRLVPGNRLAVSLVVPSRGVATGSDTFTALPPTMVTLLAGGLPDAAESAKANVAGRLVAEEIQKLDRPLSGLVRLELDVERPRS